MKKAFIKILLFLPLVTALAGPIIWIDPLHLFNRGHSLNSTYYYDQRLIKTNMLNYEHPDYNALLIGSSRVQRIGNMEHGPYQFFNYGLGDLMLYDYPGFIRYAVEKSAQPIECVVIVMDFYGSSLHRMSDTNWRPTSQYIQDSQNIPYLLRLMVSPQSFKYSGRQIGKTIIDPAIFHKNPVFKIHEDYYNRVFTGYEYNPAVKDTLAALRREHADKKLIFITSPVSVKHLQIIKNNNRFPEMLAWIKNLSLSRDGFYHFTDVTPLATHRANWFDANHTHPTIFQKYIEQILDGETENPNYVYITPQNADSVITAIQTRLKVTDLSRWADEK